MDINQKLTEELAVRREQVDAAVKLIDEGNTIPFISRYRKEATGSLNDEQLRKLYERLVYLRNLEEKKEQVLSSIEEQGKLTEDLKSQILAAETLVVVEDLYSPVPPKEKDKSDDRERERSGTACSSYYFAKNERVCGRCGESVYFGGKRRRRHERSNQRGKRYYCGSDFR